ncbi:MAG: hypothetical protein IJY23_05360 [Clostridia bacterium]|nr:hypothetical protein [Clostridia bacterium]
MKKGHLNSTYLTPKAYRSPAKKKIKATVPGAAGLDYARERNYPPYYFGENYKNFAWCEDEYFIYETNLNFTLSESERAYLVFEGVDYEFDVRIDGKVILHKEGMFTPTKIDVTAYNVNNSLLEVVIYPIPKYEKAKKKNSRQEAVASCKPASSYGWDWHPRLVPSGIWKDAYLEIHGAAPTSLDASYRLTDDLKLAEISAKVNTVGDGSFNLELLAPDGTVVYSTVKNFTDSSEAEVSFTLENPLLWYPVGYGEHPVYTLAAYNDEKRVERKIGFRRVKLLRNFDDTNPTENSFPKTRYAAPATIEVNGRKIFAKGTNLVNIEIFPALMTEERYRELLTLVHDANMNIVRMWGGGFINHDSFYDICDSLGIMVWQEFMLSCNLHPDDDKYLSVLKSEASYIIKNLRTHPSITLWCGGNELFNSWSGLTDQSHPLRMLNSLCYELDRFTPFNATSPLFGMGHGTYHTLFDKREASSDDAGLGGAIACEKSEEFITVLTRSYFTAYTEFGSSGCASPEYIKKYIMSEEDYNDFSDKNPVWVAHHAFSAWNSDSWARPCEIGYYFGGYDSVDDFIKKSMLMQSISYKSLFEEMRRQWPHCSMGINWDFNEPWPCAAGNSLVGWPCEIKPAYYAVKEALRPKIASIRTYKNRFLTGDKLSAEVFILNDSDDELSSLKVKAYLKNAGGNIPLGEFSSSLCPARSNEMIGKFEFVVDSSLDNVFTITLEVEGHGEMNSHYELIRR